jgi:hypothetical protein
LRFDNVPNQRNQLPIDDFLPSPKHREGRGRERERESHLLRFIPQIPD